MTREELEEAIRHATRVTLSEEVDIAPIEDDEDYTLATLIDAELGEWSQFHQEHGYYVQGVNVTTAVLPNGWEVRTVHLAPDGPGGAYARCLDPHDLCAAKLVRGENKDLEFVDALVEAGLIDPTSLVRICKKLPVGETRRDITIKRAQAFLK